MEPTSFSPVVARIDSSCIRRNLHRLGVVPQAVMPVIKSDAYGHGLVPVAQELSGQGVLHFAVCTVDEGCALRQAGLQQTIVILLGACSHQDIALARKYRLTPVVYSFEALACIKAYSSATQPLDIALKCDTGMARLGFAPQEIPALREDLRQTPWVQPRMVLSHLACADMPECDAFTREQIALFAGMASALGQDFPHLQRSLCNSAGMLAYPQAGDLARPGIALYGGNPFYGTAREALGACFEHAMSVTAPVLQIRELTVGQPASYGSLFVAQRPTRLAVLGIGYADGYPRTLTQRAEVVLHGQRASVCARVCMGMVLVDVTDIPAVKTGDTAWIMGGPHPNAVTVHELASWWCTISYEVLCVLGKNTRMLL